MTAQLALLRWTVKLVRREWRQHLLVVAMIAFGIATATVLVASAVRTSPPSEQQFGAAASVVDVFIANDDESAELRQVLSTIATQHPGIEVITRQSGQDGIELFHQELDAPLGRPWLELREGRVPLAGEVALTARAVERLGASTDRQVRIGEDYPFDGRNLTLVGLIENPARLGLAAGLVDSADLTTWDRAQVLLPSDAMSATDDLFAISDLDGIVISQSDRSLNSSSQLDVSIGAYLLGTVLCLQIAILASAGFTVLANRRTRQLGMLSAIGAEPRQLGSVMRLTGLVCGLLGGILGLAVGAGISAAITPLLQSAVDFRLATFDLPWLALAPAIPLAVITALIAAWWPARRVVRASTVDSIAARRPTSGGFVHSLVGGLALAALGSYLLTVGAPKNSPLLVVSGALALVVGALMTTPGVVVGVGSLARRGPLSMRLALRDLTRNRARSSAAVAAAAIAIALPFGIGSFMASYAGTWQPNLPNDIASVHATPAAGAADEFASPPAEIAAIAELVTGAVAVPVLQPIDREMSAGMRLAEEDSAEPADETSPEFLFPVQIQEPRRNGSFTAHDVALATPALLAAMHLEPPKAGTDLLVLTDARLDIDPGITVERRAGRRALAFPDVLLVRDIPAASFDDSMSGTWYVVGDGPLTQLDRDRIESTAREFEMYAGFAGDEPSFLAMRSIALAVAGLLALGVVAVTVALIRAEATNETRVLTAVGAGPLTSRAIGGIVVAALVLSAVAIAVPATFLALLGVYLNPDEAFDFAMPWMELGVLLVAVPAIGAVLGSLLTSTDPTASAPLT